MAEQPDKRRRTDLDLFILALVDSGVSTMYDLQKGAGLSQGATAPALQRLLAARFVRQGKPGTRGRTDYKVTANGRKLLRGGWQPLIKAGPSGDLDSDLRIALLAMWAGGDHRVAADFLRQSGTLKMESVAATEPTSDAVAPLARWYTDLRSSAAKALLAAEAEAIRVVVDSLPKNLKGKPKPNKRSTKSQKVS